MLPAILASMGCLVHSCMQIAPLGMPSQRVCPHWQLRQSTLACAQDHEVCTRGMSADATHVQLSCCMLVPKVLRRRRQYQALSDASTDADACLAPAPSPEPQTHSTRPRQGALPRWPTSQAAGGPQRGPPMQKARPVHGIEAPARGSARRRSGKSASRGGRGPALAALRRTSGQVAAEGAVPAHMPTHAAAHTTHSHDDVAQGVGMQAPKDGSVLGPTSIDSSAYEEVCLHRPHDRPASVCVRFGVRHCSLRRSQCTAQATGPRCAGR